MPFRDKISGCFGSEDKNFSGHPLDTDRAKEMLIEALNETKSWSEFENAIRDHLAALRCNSNHIEEQMNRAGSLKNYFAND